MVHLLDLPQHLIEKILSYIERPHDELALVCQSFYDAICRINRYELIIGDFCNLSTRKGSGYHALLKTKRKIVRFEVTTIRQRDAKKIINLIAAIGRNIEMCDIRPIRFSLTDYQKILSSMPKCKKLTIFHTLPEFYDYSTIKIPIIRHNLQHLELSIVHYWPFLQSFMNKSHTLQIFFLFAQKLNFEEMKIFFLHQINIRTFKVCYLESVKNHTRVFENPSLVSLEIFCMHEGSEDIFQFMHNQTNLRCLILTIGQISTNAVLPIRHMENLQYLKLVSGFEVKNLVELNFLRVQLLDITEKFFLNSSDFMNQRPLHKITNLKLEYKEILLAPQEFPFAAISTVFPSLQNFELCSRNNLIWTGIFIEKCLQHVLELCQNLVQFIMVDFKIPIFDNEEVYHQVSLDSLLEDNRENANLKILKLNFPMNFKTVHILKLAYDYPELEHLLLNIGHVEDRLKDLMLNIFILILKKWKKLKTLEVHFGKLKFNSRDFECIVEHGLHLNKIKFYCGQIENHEDIEKMFEDHFKKTECQINGFKIAK